MKNQKKKSRLDEPTGRLGVPPDAPQGAGYAIFENKVLIVTDSYTAAKMIGCLKKDFTICS